MGNAHHDDAARSINSSSSLRFGALARFRVAVAFAFGLLFVLLFA